MEQGADINISLPFKGKETTPLVIAIDLDNEDTLRIMTPRSRRSNITTGLFHAAKNGKCNMLKVLLEEWDKNLVDAFVPRLIPYAVLSNDADTINLLLDHTSHINIADTWNKKNNIVFTVARNGQTDILKRLIEQGLDIDARNIDSETLLMIAAINGHFETVRLLVDSGADVSAADNDGKSAMDYAECNGHSDIVSYLMCPPRTWVSIRLSSRQSDVSLFDVVDDELKSAVVNGSVNILTSLLSRSSADIDRCDERDFTLLKTAVDNKNEEIVDVLLKYGANVNFKGILNDSLYPIHIACVKGSSKIVQSLLVHGANIESRNFNYRTPLYYAVFYQHVDVVELLIKRGADVNAINGKPNVMLNTVLHTAIEKGNMSIVEVLLTSGADCNVCTVTNVVSSDGLVVKVAENTPLSIAIKFGHTDIAYFLIEHGADVYAIIDQDTMLDIACWKGSSEIVESLLDNGTTAISKNPGGISPLMVAVFYQHVDVVELLIKRGADVNAINGKPTDLLRTVLHTAVEKGNMLIVEILLRSGADFNLCTVNNVVVKKEIVKKSESTPLSIAIDLGHTDIALFLIEQGADVNAIVEKSTMLDIACWKGSSEIVKSLLDNRANVNSRNLNNVSPLPFAVLEQHLDVVELLVSRGADVNALNGWPLMYTALHKAVEAGNKSIVEFLVYHGADLNAHQVSECDDESEVPNNGDTPLNFAIESGHTDIALFLIEKGADVNAYVGKDQMIHVASYKGSTEIVNILLNKGADMNSKNLSNFSPLCYAVLGQHFDVVELLVLRGADFNALNGGQMKCTALHAAVDKGNKSIVEFLVDNGADCNARVRGKSEDGSAIPEENLPTPLSLAITGGHTDIALLLIDKKADVNSVVDDCPMLVRAIQESQDKEHRLELVRSLITHGADVNAKTNSDMGKVTEIYEAVLENRISEQLLKNLIESGTSFTTALLTACYCGYEDIVEELLAHKANVNVAPFAGVTPLVLGIANHRIVEMLLSNGADVNKGMFVGHPLTVSIQGGHLDTLRVLLDHKVEVNSRRHPLESTPLHLACEEGQYAIVELLLNRGADVNAMSGYLGTPLCSAVQKKRVAFVRLLIERGADVNINLSFNGSNTTPLTIAVDAGDEDIVRTMMLRSQRCNITHGLFKAATIGKSNLLKVLLDEWDKDLVDAFVPKLIPYAVQSNDSDTINLLLDRTSDIYIADTRNKTNNIVFTLAANGQTDILKQLICRGVDIGVRNIDGETLLIIAAINGHFETVRLLVDSGADVSAADNDNKSAMHYAECKGLSDIVSYLKCALRTLDSTKLSSRQSNVSLFDVVDCGTAKDLLSKQDADVENCDGLRPLHFAARRGLGDLAQLLIDFGATVDATDSAGNTPLHEAARQGLEITKLLLKHTNRINVQNNNGRTPLHEAVNSKNYVVALYLIENGADPAKGDNWMNTAFHYTWFLDFFEASSVAGSLMDHLCKCVKPNIMGVSVLGRLKCYSSYLSESDRDRIDRISNKYTCSDVDVLGNTELHRVVGVYRVSKLSPLCSDSGEAVKILLKSSEVNLNAKNIFWQTPLHVTRDVSAVKVCLEHGLGEVIIARDKCGRNFWHLLADRDDVEQVVTFIEQLVPQYRNTGIEATDDFDRTPLHYAVNNINFKWFATWLINEATQCETIQDWYGKTPSAYYHDETNPSFDLVMPIYMADPNLQQELRNRMSWSLTEEMEMEMKNTSTYQRRTRGFKDFKMREVVRRKHQTDDNLFSLSSWLVSYHFTSVLRCFEINLLSEELPFRQIEDEALFISSILTNYRCRYSENEETLSSNPENGTKSEKNCGSFEWNHSVAIFESITKLVTSFLQNLLEHVAEIDQRFRGRLMPAGSSYENTKVDLCDEFDFIVVLESFSELFKVIDSPGSPPGFVLLQMADNKQQNATFSKFSEFFDGENNLNTRMIKFKFEVLVKQVLNRASFLKENDCLEFFFDNTIDRETLMYSFSPDRLATNFRIKFTKPINGQQIVHKISIDIVPAVRADCYWPMGAVQNTDELLTPVYESVPKHFHLVFDQPQKKHPWVGWKSPHARVDFSVLESNIIRGCHPVVRAACVVAKKIVKSFCDFKFFKSYVIKAALMHCIMVSGSANIVHPDYLVNKENTIKDADEDFKSKLTLLVQKVMKRLLCFVLQDFVPSVFMPSFVLPVCSFEPHVKFSHMTLHRSGIASYKELIDTTLMSGGEISNKLIDSQFEHIIKAFVITHMMYWSVLLKATTRKMYFPPINPLHEEDYWPCMAEDDNCEALTSSKTK